MLCVFIITLDKIMAIGYNLIMQKIVVSNQYFSVKDTLTCGQVFRFKELPSGEYEVISRNKRCVLREVNGGVEITADDVEYFTEYFDLKRDYAKIVSSLSGFDELRDCVNYGKGIRILRQDFDETLFSFIVSATMKSCCIATPNIEWSSSSGMVRRSRPSMRIAPEETS